MSLKARRPRRGKSRRSEEVSLRKVRVVGAACLSRLILLLVGLGSLSACASYYQKNKAFNKAFEQGDMPLAEKELRAKKRAERKKDRFVYFLDRGTVAHMQGKWEESNEYFEKAYIFGEDNKKNVGDAVLSTLNPKSTLYKGEYHEHLIPLYYKALNYVRMGNLSAALVECRRLNLRLKELSDRSRSDKKYTRDAFIHTLMGLMYEAQGETNNAFIAYRNAYEVYRDDYGDMFQVWIPEQLKKDVLRSAKANGFEEEYLRLKEDMGYEKEISAKNLAEDEGELVVFWNNGLGPVKDQIVVAFVMAGGVAGFYASELDLFIPWPTGSDPNDLSNFDSVTLALPKYSERTPYYNAAKVTANGKSYALERLENVSAIAFKLLRERLVAELSKALFRVAVKEILEGEIRKKNPWLGLAADIFGTATEQADTRCWQTLPHSIYYARIPLKAGKQKISLRLEPTMEGSPKIDTWDVDIKKGKVTFLNVSTIRSHVLENR